MTSNTVTEVVELTAMKGGGEGGEDTENASRGNSRTGLGELKESEECGAMPSSTMWCLGDKTTGLVIM